MSTTARICLVAAATAVGVGLAVPVRAGNEAASRIVDRTVLCKPTGGGFPDPVRVVDVTVTPRLGSRSPFGLFHSPAGGPSAVFKTGPDFGRGTGQVFIGGCSASRARIPLSPRGLRGGRTTLGERIKCDVPARVLVRLRAVFRTPVTLRAARGGLLARGRIASAELQVVAERSRKAIVYLAASDGTGQARLFTNRSLCGPA